MANLPLSFARDGFRDYVEITKARKYRRLMIGTEGESESGKTEFMASAPGPGVVVCIDRGHEAMLENPNPPSTRRNDYAYVPLQIPVQQSALGDKAHWVEAWRSFRSIVYKALDNPDCKTVGIDTDSASWELQQLAEFGRTRSIMPLMTVDVKAARRAFITRCYDSGKNIIGSNMLKDEWVDVLDEDGNPKIDDKGKKEQQTSGRRKRQGFPDQDYLWQIQLRHMSKPGELIRVGGKTITLRDKVIEIGGKMVKGPTEYGIKILKCKVRSDVVGEELWGEDCNFAGLVQLIYPDTPLSEWGYK